VIKNQAQRPPLSVLWIYALGQLGWSLSSYGIGSLLTYFYMPPEGTNAQMVFPSYISQTTIMGLTVIGIISFSGRLLDAFIDPFVANISDKTNSRFGKRKIFMAIAAVPLALFSYLIFKPITVGVSFANTFWLIDSVFFFYIALALYVIPYNALISELGHVQEDRVKISTIISVTWSLGFLIGSSAPALQGMFEKGGLSSLEAFQKTMGIFAIVSLIFLLIPVFFLNENKYAAQNDIHGNLKDSLNSVFKNKKFKVFSSMFLFYWMAMSFIQLGIIYYVTVILKMDKSMAAIFGACTFFASFLFYPMMAGFEKKMGKKRTINTGFILLLMVFMVLLLPIPSMIRFLIITILAAFPLAAFGILPNTIVADIVHENMQNTGKYQAGMFYGVTAFMMKVGVSLANLIFPSLLVFGKSVENPIGVQMTVIAALLFCGLGLWVFRNYEE
jgi:glycoside/pentoside/hexuronide:cation symporter, GPH family